MHEQYKYILHEAKRKAAQVQQADFVESLDLCLQIAIRDEEGITIARAIEMLDRSAHFFECMHKYFESNLRQVNE